MCLALGIGAVGLLGRAAYFAAYPNFGSGSAEYITFKGSFPGQLGWTLRF